MTDEQRDLLGQARDSIDAATLLLDAGYAGFSAARSYYAMFYVAEALLLGRGLSFSRHSAVIAAFGLHFTKTGALPVEYQRYLTEAESLRHFGGLWRSQFGDLRQCPRTDPPRRAVLEAG